ncbi:GNAT family N-acetyltransferase [Treponema brennaborense]|uniref:GCN5-related N-acetyltransferase n=1 Tax=Treponema brennaborense (strain DSM 12168 / CIP 105900 / DD5/3) TaxID=906968 RepID=F4LMC1_TREBD|nr:GNAT family N-acetyltransferase [Treponema brennaborense]AEE17787.1 GCN5-related N-acetyltransferase [Treponema brennaborense DSM 12168]
MIRFVRPETDAPRILSIYKPFITDTAVSFEYEIPTLEAFTGRIRSISNEFPYLVWEEDDADEPGAKRIGGYVYASRHAARAAYQWGADLSVYLAPESRGKGIGRQLYEALFRLLQRQGYLTVYAAVAVPHPASERFHESLGFKRIALFPAAGCKFGVWHDLLWLEKPLYPETGIKPVPTAAPVPVTELGLGDADL